MRVLVAAVVRTCHEGVQRLDAVDLAGRQELVEGTIHCGRREHTGRAQSFEQVVGAQRLSVRDSSAAIRAPVFRRLPCSAMTISPVGVDRYTAVA